MATVTGLTYAKANEILNQSVVAGQVNPVSGHLVLTTKGGQQLDGGDFTTIVTDIMEDEVTEQVNATAPGLVATEVANKMVGTIFDRPDANGTINVDDITADQLVNATLKIKLIGNSTLSAAGLNAVSRKPGTQFIVKFTQDATGGRTLTTTGIKKSQGILTLSTEPNAIDLISFFYDGTDWYAGAMGLKFS